MAETERLLEATSGGRRQQRAASAISVSPLKPQQESNFYNVPDSTASNLILETLGAGEGIADLPARKRQINHNTTYEVLEDGRKRQVSLVNPKAKVTIELPRFLVCCICPFILRLVRASIPALKPVLALCGVL